MPLPVEGCAAGGVELGGEGLTHQPGGWGPVTLVQGVRARIGSNLNTERTGLGLAVRVFVGHEGPASSLTPERQSIREPVRCTTGAAAWAAPSQHHHVDALAGEESPHGGGVAQVRGHEDSSGFKLNCSGSQHRRSDPAPGQSARQQGFLRCPGSPRTRPCFASGGRRPARASGAVASPGCAAGIETP